MIIIAVFSIWIMAVFYLITNNLQRLDETKTRNIATFLAKEWIELAFNAKESNLLKEIQWDCIFTDANITNPFPEFCDKKFSSWTQWKYLQIWFDTNKYPYFKRSTWNSFQINRLYYHSWTINWNKIFWYNNDSNNWQETVFARYIVFTWIKENSQILPINKILKLESHVLFSKWNKTWKVILESFIWNY